MNNWSFLSNYGMLDSKLSSIDGDLFEVYLDLEKKIITNNLSWVSTLGIILEQVLRITADKFSISVGDNTPDCLFRNGEFNNVLKSVEVDKGTILYFKHFYSIVKNLNIHGYSSRLVNSQKKAIEYTSRLYKLCVLLFNSYFNEHIPHEFNKDYYLEAIDNYNKKHHEKSEDLDIIVYNNEDEEINELNSKNGKGTIYNAVKLGKYDIAIACLLYKLRTKVVLSKNEISCVIELIDLKNEDFYYTVQNFDLEKVFERDILKKLIMFSIENRDYYFLYEYIDKIKFKNELDNDIFIKLLESDSLFALSFFNEIRVDNIEIDENIKKRLHEYASSKDIINFVLEYEELDTLRKKGLSLFYEIYRINIDKTSLNILKNVKELHVDIVNKYLNRKNMPEYDIDKKYAVYVLKDNKDNKAFSKFLTGNNELITILEDEHLIKYYDPTSWINNLDIEYQLELVSKKQMDSTDIVIPTNKERITKKAFEYLVILLKKNLPFKDTQINDILNNELFYKKDIINSIDDHYVYNYIKNYSFMYKIDTEKFLKLISYFKDDYLKYILSDGYYDSKIVSYINSKGYYLYDYSKRINIENLNVDVLLKNLSLDKTSVIFTRVKDFDTYIMKHKSLKYDDIKLLFVNSRFEDYDLYNYIIKLIDDLNKNIDIKIRPYSTIFSVVINDDSKELKGSKGIIKNYIYTNCKDKNIISIVKKLFVSDNKMTINDAILNMDYESFLNILINNPLSIYDISEDMLDSFFTEKYSWFNDLLFNNINSNFYSFDINRIKHSYFIFRNNLLDDKFIKYLYLFDDLYLSDLLNKYKNTFVIKVNEYLLKDKKNNFYNRLFNLDSEVLELIYNNLNSENVILINRLSDENIAKLREYNKFRFDYLVNKALESKNIELILRINKYINYNEDMLKNMDDNLFVTLLTNGIIPVNKIEIFYEYLMKNDKSNYKKKIIDSYDYGYKRAYFVNNRNTYLFYSAMVALLIIVIILIIITRNY